LYPLGFSVGYLYRLGLGLGPVLMFVLVLSTVWRHLVIEVKAFYT